MIALTADLPRNSSRTSTHAMIVPMTALMSAASAATTSVSFSAATASGLEIASQKPPEPFLVDDHTSAAIGSAITTVMKVATKPSERAAPALSLTLLVSTRSRSGGAASAVSGSGASSRTLDLGHQAVRSEPLLVGGAPAADRLVVDRELAGPHRELPGELRGCLLVHGAEAELREHLLLGLRLDELD